MRMWGPICVFSLTAMVNLYRVPVCLANPSSAPQLQEASGRSATAKHIGAIKTIASNIITLTPDSGPEINVTVEPTTRIVRIAPGERTLKNATPLQAQDLQVGDRILAAGKASDDGKAMLATSVVVMRRSDVEAHKEQDRQDWRARGIGGLVKTINPAADTVTISVPSVGGTKTIDVRASKDTRIRRYAPDSMKFDAAKPSTLQEIQPGDQLRARGNRSADGTEMMADEIVTGSFRNVAGVVDSVDASAGTMDVQDLLTKKLVLIRVTPESQLHQLPPQLAQRIAMRLKAGTTGATQSPDASANAPESGSGAAGAMSGGMRSDGSPDLQQMLSRMPAVTLADLHKGDAVMIVTTQGTPTGGAAAITLLSGVDPILQAAPNGSQVLMLSPWSLGTPGEGDTGQ